MELVDLEQKLAVNPFGKMIEIDKRPELITDLDMNKAEAAGRMVAQYKTIGMCRDSQDEEQFHSLNIEALTLRQLEVVISGILLIDKARMKNPVTSLYISKLIQESYCAGNNGFIINTPGLEINLIRLNARQDNPIHATIIGNVGNEFGDASKNCIFNIHGNVEAQCGYYTTNCTYIMHGSVKSGCGWGAHNCFYQINGDVGSTRGNNSVYLLNDNLGFTQGKKRLLRTYNESGNMINQAIESVKNETLKVIHREAYDILIEELPPGNIIQLTSIYGRIIEEMKK